MQKVTAYISDNSTSGFASSFSETSGFNITAETTDEPSTELSVGAPTAPAGPPSPPWQLNVAASEIKSTYCVLRWTGNLTGINQLSV